jgi:hypothetical protein
MNNTYEGRCEHCGRDIGAGHEPGCPYRHGLTNRSPR